MIGFLLFIVYFIIQIYIYIWVVSTQVSNNASLQCVSVWNVYLFFNWVHWSFPSFLSFCSYQWFFFFFAWFFLWKFWRNSTKIISKISRIYTRKKIVIYLSKNREISPEKKTLVLISVGWFSLFWWESSVQVFGGRF
jgi:hypothetical protein